MVLFYLSLVCHAHLFVQVPLILGALAELLTIENMWYYQLFRENHLSLKVLLFRQKKVR